MIGAKKSKIFWEKFERLFIKKGKKISQKIEERENEVLVYICFEMKRLVEILIEKSGIYL